MQPVFRFLDELYLDQQSATGLRFLPLYIVISLTLYGFQRWRKGPVRKSFLSFLFPKDVYLHPSSRLDFKMLFLNGSIACAAAVLGFASGFRFTGFLGSLHQSTHSLTMHAFARPSTFPGLFHLTGFWVNLAFTFSIAIARDLGRVLVHYPMHKIPALWEIHKYHHNAEVLTPFTAYRLHPIESGLSSLSGGLCSGACVSIFIWTFGTEKISLVTLAGISVIKLLTHSVGVFEHGNKWLSFGRLGYIFANPASHLVHHSTELRHRDKNFSNHFAFFDLILGTLYIPKREEHFRIGVDQADGQPLLTRSLVRQFYFTPVIEFIKTLTGRTAVTTHEVLSKEPAANPPALNCWCGPNCPVLANPSLPEAQPAAAWTHIRDLFDEVPQGGQPKPVAPVSAPDAAASPPLAT